MINIPHPHKFQNQKFWMNKVLEWVPALLESGNLTTLNLKNEVFRGPYWQTEKYATFPTTAKKKILIRDPACIQWNVRSCRLTKYALLA